MTHQTFVAGPLLWKNVLSCNVEKSFKKFLDPDLAVDEFQNLMHKF